MKYYLDIDIDDGDANGLYVFYTKQEALDFIERNVDAPNTPLSAFTLIEGKKLILKPVEVIIKITAE